MSGGGSGGGGGGEQVSTTKVELPSWATPYSQQILREGAALHDQPYQSYPGQKISPLTPEHEMALTGITNRAIQGSPEISAARQNMTDTLTGQYMNPDNPYLSGAMDVAAGQITDNYMKAIAPGTSAAFGRSGAYGGSAYQEAQRDNQAALGQSLGNAAKDVYFQNYNNERLAQQRAQTLAPQYQSMDYGDAQALLGVGDIRRGYGQDILNANQSEWQRAQQHPYTQLDVLSNSLRSAIGGQGTTTQSMASPYQPNATAGMLGGGLLGYGAASQYGGQSMFGQNPLLGAGAGALLGGLTL